MKSDRRTLTLALLAAGFLSAARAQPAAPGLYQELHWRNIGPFRGGRTRAAAGVPEPVSYTHLTLPTIYSV